MKRSLLLHPLFLFFAAISFIGCAVWFLWFQISINIVAIHLLWVCILHLFVVSSILLLVQKDVQLLRIASSLYASFFFAFYVLVAWSIHGWGDIVTVKILATYLRDLNGFSKSIGVHKSWLFGSLALYLITFFVGTFFILKKGLLHINAISWRTLFLYFLATGMLLIGTKRFFHKQGEPFLVFCFDRIWGLTNNPFFTANRIAVGKSDTKLFERYKQHHSLQKSNQKNIILIVCDALRADHLPMYGYQRNTSPFIDSLYESGAMIKVENCITTSASTTCGIPSLFLSRNWKDCAVNGFNLFKLLHFSGYKTHAIIAGAHKEWYNLAKFYTEDCDFYFDGKDSKSYYFKDDRVVLEGLNIAVLDSKTPSFFYLHFQSPHETALLRDSFTIYKPSEKGLAKSQNYSSLINRYDNKILQADDAIRSVFRLLKQKGILENSLVYITADHGEGLGEHGVDGHVDWLYQPQISVPLLIFGDTSIYQNTRFARQIDIAPTIVERVGLIIPSSWQGKSIISNPPYQYSYHETGKNNLETNTQKFAIISFSDTLIYKYIFTKDLKSEELYELKNDPKELYNLVNQNPNLVKEFREIRRQKGAAVFE